MAETEVPRMFHTKIFIFYVRPILRKITQGHLPLEGELLHIATSMVTGMTLSIIITCIFMVETKK